ncbi:MAG: NAD(P)/FAD-dependent oxidoreductase [Chloroflexaceae bacterium]|nr:NAD(P)/FAD-dependent oxidoreductase [Chloroflexaceae bacterium]
MYDCIVVGSGLAGSSLATVLSRQGWHVLLLERRHLPQHKVCGEFLSPEAQAILGGLGLYDTVAHLHPATMDMARLTTPAGLHLHVQLPGQAWGVSRFALDAALLAAAAEAGATVRTGITVTGTTPTSSGHIVAARCGQDQLTFTARAVVVACGRNPVPALRPVPDAPRPTIAQTHIGVKCHYTNLAMPPQVELYLFPGGYVGLSPVEDGRANLCLLTTHAAFTAAGASAEAMLAAVCHWNQALARRLQEGTFLPDTQVTVASVDLKQRAVPWNGVARVGDAVTMIPPLCGDGMAMALRSAQLCAPLAHDFLRGACSLAGWEEHYRRQWHRTFDPAMRVGRMLQAALIQPGVHDMLLLLGNILPPLARTAVHTTRATR